MGESSAEGAKAFGKKVTLPSGEEVYDLGMNDEIGFETEVDRRIVRVRELVATLSSKEEAFMETLIESRDVQPVDVARDEKKLQRLKDQLEVIQ